MPKNIILKDNVPKIYEVREVENKIPTYEEFMKNYQADQAVNDSYENEIASYNYIGAPKASGPCSVCYKDTSWTSLRMPCPVESCNNMTPTNLTHTCGGQLEVSNQAQVRCKSCGASGSITNFSLGCSAHSSVVSRYSLQRALNWTLQMSDNQVMVDLAMYLRSHN